MQDRRGVHPREQALALAQQPRLPHARLPDQGDQVGAALAVDPVVDRLQQLELVAAPHQGRLAPDRRASQRLGRGDADGLPGGNRLRLALELERPHVAVLDCSFGGPDRALAHGNRPGAARDLQPGRHVDRVAGDGVGIPYGAGQHLAGIDPDAQGEGDAVGRLGLDVELLHRGLHAQRGPDGALGVVLMGNRGAEQRHHVVADVLVDRAAEAHDLLAEPAQAAIHHGLDGLGVHSLRHRGVAREVREQDAHLAALLRRRARPRRHRDGDRARGVARLGGGRRRGGSLADLGAAVHAEAGLGRDGFAARRTAQLERRSAVHAEARTVRILGRAVSAHHPGHHRLTIAGTNPRFRAPDGGPGRVVRLGVSVSSANGPSTRPAARGSAAPRPAGAGDPAAPAGPPRLARRPRAAPVRTPGRARAWAPASSSR